ncbi:Putative DNA-binding domain-containing protein [Flaviramulus basaltis]|uniref:Putative DNA-binding domain-containing protein n=1 Tax=Flaviramulus basaltis TaxID=369401 RepID=A0A1K2IR75_9FLAO|nr:ATP-binding protein [Flaviramulus basaltis]SFZ94806.1 Putative DNA-binding domain-containing protein [Flaviramulus basaltis]
MAKIKIILIHLLLGTGVFYFIVHPFTMALYWFEYSNTPLSTSLFIDTLNKNFLKSFSFEMRGMSTLLTLFGSALGLVSGFFWSQLKKKDNLINVQQRLLYRDIAEIIADGENEMVEFKSSIRYDYYRKATNRDLEKVIAKTITGFMNANGGKLIIGVDDDGNVLGLEKDFKTLKHKNRDGYEREVFRIISTQLGHEACFSNHISFYSLNEKDVCLVDIEPSEKPIYVSDTENTTFYVRTGNATYPLSVKEAVNYLETRKS